MVEIEIPRETSTGKKKYRINVTLTDSYVDKYQKIKENLEDEAGVIEDAGVIRALINTYYRLKFEDSNISKIR